MTLRTRRWMGLALAGLMAMGLGLGAGEAQARGLEEILKEKGMITDVDYAEATKSRAFGYTPATTPTRSVG